MVKLSNRQILYKTPRYATIMRDVQSTVISFNYKRWIFRMNPECMMIRVNFMIRCKRFKSLSTILTLTNYREQVVQTVFVFGVHVNICVIKRTVSNVFGTHKRPVFTTIIGSIETGFFC